MTDRNSVTDLVGERALQALATPANLRLGRGIAAKGGVEFLEFGPLRLVAKVAGGQRRTIQLDAIKDGLAWKCSCSSRVDLFCKHCVAAAIVAVEKTPNGG